MLIIIEYCSHYRANELFWASLTTRFLAIHCASHEEILRNQCTFNNVTGEMGGISTSNTIKPHGVFYLETKSKAPFEILDYTLFKKIKVIFKADDEAENVEGKKEANPSMYDRPQDASPIEPDESKKHNELNKNIEPNELNESNKQLQLIKKIKPNVQNKPEDLNKKDEQNKKDEPNQKDEPNKKGEQNEKNEPNEEDEYEEKQQFSNTVSIIAKFISDFIKFVLLYVHLIWAFIDDWFSG